MKIGIEVSPSTSKVTGTGRYIDCLVEQLEFTHHHITKFTYGSENNLFDKSKIKFLYQNKHLYREFILKKEMDEAGIDCAFFPDYFLPRNFDKPAAIVIHDLSFITHPHFYPKLFIKFYNWKLKNTLAQNPVITAVSENTKKSIVNHLHIIENRILLLQGYSNIVSNGSTDEHLASPAPYLLYAGHIEPRKNLTFLIENFLAWKKTGDYNIQLLIAGEIWIKSREIKYMLEKYANNDAVKFLGYVSEEKLKMLYTNAAGFVNTSFVEGFGFPVLEAMLFNLPVICSQGTACEEISAPLSIAINPYNNASLINGFNKLYRLIAEKKRIHYPQKYFPGLMQEQLITVIDNLERRLNGKKHFNIPLAPDISSAIEKTLLYAHLHNSGIHQNLLREQLFDIKVTEEKLIEAVTRLFLKGNIFIKNDIVTLNHHPYGIYNGKKINITKKETGLVLKIISKLPFIKSIAFSGGTAHYGINGHDDIDLFIITKRNTLYISYFAIHFLSLLFGVRKYICANYLLDEDSLAVKSACDYYTAHQIISLKPYKNQKLLNYFLYKNKWILEYFPNYRIKDVFINDSSKSFFFYPVNMLLFYFYRIIYRGRIKTGKENNSVVISGKCLKLHTNDHRIKTLKKFDEAWKLYLNQRNSVSSKEMVYYKKAARI